ncbi:MAG: insulinase family protein [Deltaproteobacteria bacterium]|nr:insulinase family protein [Deltaproteobacteria bacterium]MBW2666628.1 insulinase family protein [Deltaproteobacteria bacterium]
MIHASQRLAVCTFATLLALGCASKPAWELPPPAPTDAPVVQGDALTRSELANGMKVLVLEDHRIPRVALSVTVRRGEAMVDPKRAGLASFTAELMKRGAGDRDALALATAVDEIGAGLSVSAGWDSMTVSVSGLSRDLPMLIEILGDVALRPSFDRREAVRARTETLAAIEKAKDAPATLARWYTYQALFEGHRYGIPAGGNTLTVAGLDAAAARRFHGEVFVPNNAIFSASGDVRAEAMLELAHRTFGAMPRAEVPAAGAAPSLPAPTAMKILIVDRPDLEQAQIRVAHDGIARTDPDRVAVNIMNSILGGSGFSSRLMASVRADAGLTYGVHSGFGMRRQPSLFVVSTFTRVAEVRTVVDLLLAELERMRTEPPSEDELAPARTLVTGSFSLGLETSDAVIGGLVDLDVHGLPEDSLDTYRSRVRAVTVEDTAREALRRLHPGRVAIVLVGPAAQLQPQLAGLGPVEVVKP